MSRIKETSVQQRHLPEAIASIGPKAACTAASALAIVFLTNPVWAKSPTSGAQIFHEQGCAGCHGRNGGGGIGTKLAGNTSLSNTGAVIHQILHGGGGMPPFGGKLSNQQVAAVATYVRTSFGNDFGKVKASQVAADRHGGNAQSANAGSSKASNGGASQSSSPPGGASGANTNGPQAASTTSGQSGSSAKGELAVGAPAKTVRQPTTKGPSQAQLDHAGSSTADWLLYNKGYMAHRYSSLTQINTKTATKLQPVCAAQLGVQGTFESNPIVFDDRMYVTTEHNTYALNAENCHQIWEYDYHPTGPQPFNTNRGVAISHGRVFRGTTDGHVLALDAKTGKVLWNVRPVNSAAGYFLAGAPIVWHDLLIIGTGGADWGADAKLFALDVKNGRTVWTLDEIDAKTFGNADAASTGGGSNWTSFALNRKTGKLYVPVGNPAPDFSARYRPGKNLYTDSVIVVDARSGTIDHYYQQVSHDSLDRDTAATPVIFHMPADAAQAGATNYSAKGKPENVDFSNVKAKAGEKATDTGSSGTKSGGDDLFVSIANKAGHLFLYDDSTEKEIYRVPTTTIKNARATPTTKGTRVCPGINGGVEWYGPAYNPNNRQLYVGSVDWCTTFKLGEIRYTPDQFFFGGSFVFDPVKKARGWINAFSAASGKLLWKDETSLPVVGGITATAGDILFAGELSGNFEVLNQKNGKTLYSFYTGGPIAGGTATYEIGGRQYVAVPSGSSSRTWTPNVSPSATVFVFALPKSGS